MTTYSAFEPGMMRPPLLSGFAVDVHAWKTQLTPVPAQFVAMVNVKTNEPLLVTACKPWPYSLPSFLRPQPGTTFDMLHGDMLQTRGIERVGVLQAVLYGVPEPEKVLFREGVVGRVLYGVKE
jgi:hypothetical protein